MATMLHGTERVKWCRITRGLYLTNMCFADVKLQQRDGWLCDATLKIAILQQFGWQIGAYLSANLCKVML